MNNYYLHVIALDGCPYSKEAIELLNSNNNLKKKIINIPYTDIDKFKTDEISTFPQIYLKKNNSNGNLLLGGCSELKNFYNTFYKQKLSETNINKFIDQNKNWSKKATLRFIELINS